MLEVVMPLPSPDNTPPVTTMYLVMLNGMGTTKPRYMEVGERRRICLHAGKKLGTPARLRGMGRVMLAHERHAKSRAALLCRPVPGTFQRNAQNTPSRRRRP